MEITNISQLDPTQFINQDYKISDESLLNSLNINKEFGLPEDKVEVHVISPSGEVLNSVYDFKNYTTRQTIQGTSLYDQIELDPKTDLESFGINLGKYEVIYNFYRQLFFSSPALPFFISEISSDRTELKVSNNSVSYTDLGQAYLTFISERNSRAFYSDFLLNFGDNKTLIGVNVAFDNSNESYANLYIKLYEPLPPNYRLKDTFWLVESISEPYVFEVNTEFIAEATSDTTPLRGPNINIGLVEKANLTTPYLNLSSLLNSSVSSSYQQLQSWLEEKSIEITIDYTDFNNFVHFSSARERLENFKYKLTQIQSLQSDIDGINGLSISSSRAYTSASVLNLQNQLNTLIEKFDGYEYFLYYESGSYSWPKSGSIKPYTNLAPTDPESLVWFGSTDYTSPYYGGAVVNADNYDIENKNYIWNNFPEYIKEDTQNANLELFSAMLGQHYDYIWTYIKDITDLQVADNRVDYGISKDLVADTLRNFGIKLYTNSRNQEDLYLSLLGIDSNNSTLPSTGSYMIDTFVSASNNTIPDNDIVKETYKRIYHNLPYLLKTKGTRRGLRALINCFGISDTILKVKEYGGNRKDLDIIEQITPKFNYGLTLDTTYSSLGAPGLPSYKQYLDLGANDTYPDTLEFRFKLDSNNILPTQSILEGIDLNQIIRVTYISESYANIDFGLDNFSGNITYSTPLTLPLYNDDWWNVNLTRETGSIDRFNGAYLNTDQTYILTVGNKNSNGIRYLVSSSIYRNGAIEDNFLNSWIDGTIFPGGNQYAYPFTGSVQEFRYWVESISINDFEDHILNPQSIVFNSVTGSYNNLIFRLPLGSELDIADIPTIISVHPSFTASFWSGGTTSSIANTSLGTNSGYTVNYETFLVNTPNLGSITEIDEKVRIATPNLVPGDVLTPYISIQKPEIYPYTIDLNIVEVSISPQDSINEDIISQLGSFNIDEYIGDPRLDSSNSYPALTDLRNFYFKKYTNSQNAFDFIKLLSYFDNSLFKMIKDFVPAKANLSTGLVINTNILERNKIARHEPVMTFVDYSSSIETAFITGSNGLDEIYNTAYTSSTSYTSGSVFKYNTQNKELFTGELGGTIITVHSQSLDNIVYELNHIPVSTSQAINQNLYRLPINPTLNNVLTARTSPKYLDVDYGYSSILPVNINYLTASLNVNLNIGGFGFLNAPVQDSNYTLKRHINPRYNGSRLFGNLYNVYSSSYTSFGNSPVIDLTPVKFAYFKEITSQSLTLPGRVNVNTKYLIDSASNVVELTEANKSLFDLQSIFNKSNVNVSLDNINQPSKQKRLNGLKPIYAGGFRYEPILQNVSTPISTWSNLQFTFLDDIAIDNPNPNSQVTADIPNGLTVFPPSLSTQFTSTAAGLEQDNLQVALNAGIVFPVTRNTAYPGEIRQRVTGSITLNIKVSPPSGEFTTRLYNNYTGNGTPPYSVVGPYSNYWIANSTNQDPLFGAYNRIGAIRIEPGVQIKIRNHYNEWSTATYNKFTSGYPGNLTWSGSAVDGLIRTRDASIRALPLILNDDGLDGIEITYTGTTASFSANAPQNTFVNSGNTLVTSSLPYGNYPIEENDGLIVTITYPFEGLIVLPRNTPTANVFLKNMLGTVGNIAHVINFTRTSTSSRLKFRTSPTLQIAQQYGIPFYYTQAPGKIYVTGSVDTGYNSGATSTNNWYFERGNKEESGSLFTLLTASYALSKLYYDHYVDGADYYGNPIKQTLPDGPFGNVAFGYQDISEYFNPKRGDLFRFYNHDNNKFPFSAVFEREIIDIYPPTQFPGTGVNGTGSYAGRLVFEVDDLEDPTTNIPPDIPSQACINNPSGSTIGRILNFIMLSKIEDETNIVLLTEKNIGQTSPGIILPEFLNKEMKDDAGNIVKRLKAQNLLDVSTTNITDVQGGGF